MAPSGSPTVRRRRLAAELRRLRGNRTGGAVARTVGWSATKISRAESGRESLPPAEIERLIDYYGVAEPLRGRLLELAEDATGRGWWEDYADALSPEHLEFVGLEAEAESSLQWQADLVPGLLQTEDYVRNLQAAFRVVVPTTPPGVVERFVQARMRRQRRLTDEPVLGLSVVLDESVMLRRVGDEHVMRAQLLHLAQVSELHNVDLRVLPLDREVALHTGSFVIMSFGPGLASGAESLGDVVSAESLNDQLHVEGEIDTYRYRLFFQALSDAALPPGKSRDLIVTISKRVWA
ncbi:XRE family transcriptional regulator [Trebonia kvetii]|uniref:XRE family transcriptional regulator n=1 Tax=Trebonia kvetii TaxID=2480626 RepID=A0A6P2BZM0_9ACTN|nr:helix-turn-helix transcriptional regulator [Trebonia kvetii]TVZ04398.1 XRE family transcriptional regulator [Trebonia kvetii]